MVYDYRMEVDRGLQLLKLCQKLQSEKDGVKRPAPFVLDKTKVQDQFARDIMTAMANHSALYRLLPMNMELCELGKQLEIEGKITVYAGSDYSTAVLAYFRTQLGLN